MEITSDHIANTIRFKELVDNGNKELKAIRQDSKPINFKLNYLGGIDSDKGGKITPEIYNNYHEVLYKQVGVFRDEMITKAKVDGYVHLGLGCRLYVDDVDQKFRTLFNAYGGQFWSILTLLTINKLHSLIDDAGYTEDIKCIATIYDSIYYEVTDNPIIIKWLNDNLIPVMLTDYLVDQRIKNECSLELGKDWSNLIELPNNASIEEVKQSINKVKE